ncbi:hypothetical protein M0R01_04550 [bacterium]|nr:hypothetical protein [bacterium]
MKILNKFVFYILLLTFLISLANYHLIKKANEELKQEKWKLILENENLKGQIEEAHLYNRFSDVLNIVGSMPYSKENNCYEHAKLLQQGFRQNGIESSIMIGENRSHAWVGVWVEATTGNFIEPDKYKMIEVRDNNLNVICSK